uniref:Uncharacterized protein n=1 Tax=Leersia perrieri TaxID=77586 RepID=A0A1Y8Y3Z4_9ORYZ
MELLVIG